VCVCVCVCVCVQTFLLHTICPSSSVLKKLFLSNRIYCTLSPSSSLKNVCSLVYIHTNTHTHTHTQSHTRTHTITDAHGDSSGDVGTPAQCTELVGPQCVLSFLRRAGRLGLLSIFWQLFLKSPLYSGHV
jgi:hypothetical protein